MILKTLQYVLHAILHSTKLIMPHQLTQINVPHVHQIVLNVQIIKLVLNVKSEHSLSLIVHVLLVPLIVPLVVMHQPVLHAEMDILSPQLIHVHNVPPDVLHALLLHNVKHVQVHTSLAQMVCVIKDLLDVLLVRTL